MKTSYSILFLMTLLAFSCVEKENRSFQVEEIALIPKPESFTLNRGSFEITDATQFIVTDYKPMKAVQYLNKMLKRSAGFELALTDIIGEEDIVFETVANMPEEAYHLVVNPNQVWVRASDEAGFFNAIQTIRQVLPHAIESSEMVATQWLIPSLEIKDKPGFQWRGMHMDFSRHFFDVEEVKTFLDYMALYKMNTYHMHLTDDQGWRMEIKKYPLLTEKGAWRTENNQDNICKTRAVENELYTISEKNYKTIDGERKYGGFFTQEQLKAIVAYADERNITVIPEIDMPGHFMSAIDNYPFLLCEGEESGFDTVFTKPACLAEETTYEFMENILTEVTEIFPSEYIHIGGDEVNIRTWEKCPNCQSEIKKHELKDEHELQSHFNRRIEKFLKSKGKKLMGWDEIVRGGLTPEATMMWWRGWAPNAPRIAVENGNDFVNTSTSAYYFDYLNEGNTVQKVYEFEPVPKDFTTEDTEHLLGVQANLWSEWIPNFERLQYQAFPRLLAVAETGWTSKNNKNTESFFESLENHYDRLDAMDIHYYIPAVEGLDKKIVFVDSTKVNLKLAYPIKDAEIYYTLDGSVPTKQSKIYTKAIKIHDIGKIKSRAYKGDIFNDIKTAEIERQSYKEAGAVIPENKGLGLKFFKPNAKRVKDMQVPNQKFYKVIDSIALIDEVRKASDYALAFEGYFYAGEDGVYDFEMRSDGGSLLYFGEKLVVDNGGYHGPRKRYGKIALRKGWHPISIPYLPSGNPRMITVWYAKQGEELQSLDASVTGY